MPAFFFWPILVRFLDQIDLMAVRVFLRQQLVPALNTEMRDINYGGRIICQHAQNGPDRHGFQTFARSQDGQRAQQTQRIECFGWI
ncbi:hypothetical protein RUA4292_02535 [Ruegeria atlantica]|uniref:Uncharacterized protein n=1 Tax=Ruegeria atlantica TaxID=81569 RepID=A0A0P1EFM5_9RHOB|nr:hypothetical protein RUA4292_02535 [Ruegeria atlantica]